METTITLNEQQVKHLLVLLDDCLTEHFDRTTKAVALQIINKLKQE